MPSCSVCSKGPEAALTVNELLERGLAMREIEAETGIGFRSVNRHKNGDCRFSFSRYKAAKVKTRSSVNLDGREVVSWPDGVFTVYGKPIGGEELRPDDLLIRVTYEKSICVLLEIPAHSPPRPTTWKNSSTWRSPKIKNVSQPNWTGWPLVRPAIPTS